MQEIAVASSPPSSSPFEAQLAKVSASRHRLLTSAANVGNVGEASSQSILPSAEMHLS